MISRLRKKHDRAATQKKVGSLRNKAKKAYRTFMNRVDHLDCGIQLAIYMVADASELAHKFDNYLCELKN